MASEYELGKEAAEEQLERDGGENFFTGMGTISNPVFSQEFQGGYQKRLEEEKE